MKKVNALLLVLGSVLAAPTLLTTAKHYKTDLPL